MAVDSKSQTSRRASKLSVAPLAITLVALAVVSSGCHGMPNSAADCMRNPFATGCRGISAKRSAQLAHGLASWPPPETGGQQQQQQSRQVVSLYDLMATAATQADRQQLGQRARQQQLNALAVDLLVEAASRLAAGSYGAGGSPLVGVIESRSPRRSAMSDTREVRVREAAMD